MRTPSGQKTSSYQVLVRRKSGKSMKVAHGPMFTEASAQEVVRLVEAWIENEADNDQAG